jgi:serine/threonine protein kinase
MGNDLMSLSSTEPEKSSVPRVNHPHYGEIIVTPSQGGCELLAVQERNYTSAEEFNKDLRELNSKKGLTHRNLVKCLTVSGKGNISSFCATFHRITTVFEFLTHDLEREVSLRRTVANFSGSGKQSVMTEQYGTETFFQEDDLWKLLYSIISALAFFQANRMFHSDIRPFSILLTGDGEVKLDDHRLLNSGIPNLYANVLMDVQTMISSTAAFSKERFFLSPKLAAAMQRKEMQPIHNPFKSDVYSTAMTVIYAGLLAEFFDDTLNASIPTTKFLSKFATRYSSTLVNVLNLMLEQEESKRPDPITLEASLLKYFEQKGIANRPMNLRMFVAPDIRYSVDKILPPTAADHALLTPLPESKYPVLPEAKEMNDVKPLDDVVNRYEGSAFRNLQDKIIDWNKPSEDMGRSYLADQKTPGKIVRKNGGPGKDQAPIRQTAEVDELDAMYGREYSRICEQLKKVKQGETIKDSKLQVNLIEQPPLH